MRCKSTNPDRRWRSDSIKGTSINLPHAEIAGSLRVKQGALGGDWAGRYALP